MSFQKHADRNDPFVARPEKDEQMVNRALDAVARQYDMIDADFDRIVDDARDEVADFFAGLRIPGFGTKARQHG